MESSEDDGSKDKIGARKCGKGSLGKGRVSPPKKKAKATKKTLLRGGVESSEDDESEDKIGAHKFGKGLLGKGKDCHQRRRQRLPRRQGTKKLTTTTATTMTKKEPTPIYNMNRRELIAKIEEQKKTIRDLKMKLENTIGTLRRLFLRTW